MPRWRNTAPVEPQRRDEIYRHYPAFGPKTTGPLPDDILERVLQRLARLETLPRPPDVKKLKGRDAWRIRVADYRVIYEIHDRVLQVILVSVRHRREVYR